MYNHSFVFTFFFYILIPPEVIALIIANLTEFVIDKYACDARNIVLINYY